MVRSWWSLWWWFLLWFTMLWFSLTTCSKSDKKAAELESIGRDAYVAWSDTILAFAWWYWGCTGIASRRGLNGWCSNWPPPEYRRRILPHRTVRCVNDYDNSNNRNSNNKMSHLYYDRLCYDTCCSLVGGNLPFGEHTDPVFRIKLPTKLPATRCQNHQDNRMNSSNSSDITVLILKIILEMRQK